jgi:hypothetical protein
VLPLGPLRTFVDAADRIGGYRIRKGALVYVIRPT